MTTWAGGPALIAASIAAGCLTALVPGGAVVSAASFVVNSVGDEADARLDGICRTTIGTCTLRAAMTESNFLSGPDLIAFNIPVSGVAEIRPATRLPILSDPYGVTIDGYTQPGSSANTDPLVSNAVIRVQLRGTGSSGIDGIQTTSGNNLIRGLALYNFRRAIYLFGSGSVGNVVVGNFVGTDAAGTFGAPSYVVGSSGVHVQGGARDNIIGRPNPADRNVLSGNAHHGFASYDNDTDRNIVQNNLVGLTPSGAGARPNRGHGIDVNTWSSANLIGGSGPMEGNVISGNLGEGVEISHGSGTLDNRVVGNLIGTAPGGASAPAYARNGQDGVNLEGWASCDASCPADAGRSVVTDNVIVNSGAGGVKIAKGVHHSVVSRNLIGVLRNGTPAPNAVWGVRIEKGSFNNVIGPGNDIAFNPNPVQLVPDGSSPPSPTAIATFGNTFTQNVIRGGTGLGIDLAPLGSVTQAPSALVNNGVQIPTITSAQVDRVTVTTCGGCRVEVFESERAAGAFGPGTTFLASAIADGAGVATVPFAAVARPRSITATTTDTTGSTSEFARNVAVGAAVNSPPTASFTADCVSLTCHFDASASTDPDAPISAYTWDFGDGTSGDGIAPVRTFASAGPVTVTLTVTDAGGLTAQASVSLDLVRVPQAPTATFVATCDRLACSFDATGSVDPDGSIVAYEWDFGDGSTAAGPLVEHVFASAGTFGVTLAVTDDESMTVSSTQTVVVVERVLLADDGFERFVTGGWGTSPLGGTWSITSGPASNFSVDGSLGVIEVPSRSSGRGARLTAVSVLDAEIRTTFSSPTPATGFGTQVGIAARRVSHNNEYRVRVRLAANGTIVLGVVKLTGTSSEVLVGGEATAPGVTFVPGQRYHVAVSVTGANPTTIAAKVWSETQAEPTEWMITRTDAQALLQQPGSPGVHVASSSNTTTLPVVLRVDSFRVTAAS